MDVRWLPWINALRRHAKQPSLFHRGPAEVDARETGVVWLEWRWSSLNDQEQETWPRVFEALELLTLAAHADQPLWRQLMTKWCPQASFFWENEPQERRFELGCQLCVAKTGILSPSCERFVSDGIDSVVSGGYKELRAELEAKLKVSDDPPRKVIAHVRIVIDDGEWGARNERPAALSPFLFEVVQLVGLQFAKENAPLPYTCKWPPLFRIQQVRPDAFYSYHTPNDLWYLHRIVLCGVQVHHVQLNNIEITQANAPKYTAMLQCMVTGPTLESADHKWSPDRMVSLHRDATSQTYDGVFSALLHTKGVREYTHLIPDATLMEGGPPRTTARDRYWQWIAAAFFSSHATNSIEDVYLHGLEIEMQDANVFEQTLQAADPLSILFPGCTNSTNITSVSASKFRLTDDVDDEDPTATLTIASPVTGLRVINAEETSEWLSVLLPGWGQAWVKREDATLVATAVMGSSTVRRIKRLMMDHADVNVEAFMKILRAVGSGIQYLELINWTDTDTAPSEWLNRVLDACPRLEEFEINSIPLQSLEVLERGYESGTCHMKRLVLDFDRVDDIDAHASRFFDCLADPDHAMSQNLRELLIDARVQRVSGGLFLSIAAMLERNSFLSELRLGLSIFVDEPVSTNLVEAALIDPIASHNGEPVAIRRGPLARRNKLAFLSTIWGRSSTTSSLPQPAQSLDAAAVGLIFQFAAECRSRKIDVSVKAEVRNHF